MNLQQSPRRPTPELTEALNEIDRAVTRQQDLTPPDYGSPTRQAIESVVNGLVSNLCVEIGKLRKELDLIEQRAISSASKSKHALTEHVLTCERINQEVGHMRDVITELTEQTREP